MDSLQKEVEAIRAKKEQAVPSVSGVFAEAGGEYRPLEWEDQPAAEPEAAMVILETVYRPDTKKTGFVLWDAARQAWQPVQEFRTGPLRKLVPYSSHNPLIRDRVVLFPSEPEEYGTDADLLAAIQAFIHRYMEVGLLYEQIAAHYVLLSWIYENFHVLPYLRLRGDPGSGKTRFLEVVGSLCYKPIFASGASTTSPIFRMINAFRGTLIIDESDFRFSDEKADFVKILNNGNARGFPVLRSETTATKEIMPASYVVFGPKIVATRSYFEDRALESRCITEEMNHNRMRSDIPSSLPSSSRAEALAIRNRLLLFRFRNLHKMGAKEHLKDPLLEPRLNQIYLPLLSLMEDEKVRKEVGKFARAFNRQMVDERSGETEAQLLSVIRDLWAASETLLTMKQIADEFEQRHGLDYERRITPRWIGMVIRRSLKLSTHRTKDGFVLPKSQQGKVENLCAPFGVHADPPHTPERPSHVHDVHLEAEEE